MATYTPNVPPSEYLKNKRKNQNAEANGGDGEDGPRRQTKEEYRKMKELEEARKAGTVPAMTDIETGADINPHIPHYIAQAPWYVGAKGPTLHHQKPHAERQVEVAPIDTWYERGPSTKVATKYRAGACENCGSMTHKKKDCFERPRRLGAKFTGEDIAPDDRLQPDLNLNYDAKRDRWNGYDPSEHKAIIDEFQRLEDARKVVKVDRIEKGLRTSSTANGEDEDLLEENKKLDSGDEEPPAEAEAEVAAVDDDDKYAEHADMPGVKLDTDSRTRITVRNLRIREDTAKYLYNLDPESAHYDPKSRAMRENPFATKGKTAEDAPFGGDNFTRYTGEVVDVNEAQLFAWEAHKRGIEAHSLAEPTKLAALRQEFETRKDTFKNSQQNTVLQMYGGEEHLKAPPKELLLAQSELYVEYNRKGKIIKGAEKPVVKSRYEEDVFQNNHKSIWGSYWKDGQWGYRCCHGFIKNSVCTGDAGKNATENAVKIGGDEKFLNDNENERMEKRKAPVSSGSDSSSDSDSSDSSSSSTEEEEKAVRKKKAEEQRSVQRRKRRQKQKEAQKRRRLEGGSKTTRRTTESTPSDESEDEVSDDKEDEKAKKKRLLREALIKQAEEERIGEKMRKMDDRQRAYNSRYEDKPVTEVELEAYRLRRALPNDPMAGKF